ncbi:zinc finger BED domain-containing protein RICESLEEPER 1-like [Rosa rugosa]|uniref:zinc finger BED domain-containing protein RICESLEEPER 1-like n=1 Tax=Rosa rugosa TaxID=74645 RepID=UPI002B414F59|nr:zinc finger BED domain-containing protein RICESLEEPER 1-like [Rosa rugosa]
MATNDSRMGNEVVPASEGEGKEEKQPPTSQKMKRKRVQKKKVKPLKPSSRSWVWEHFEKFDKLIYNTVDGKQVKVGHEVRAKCVYCFTELAGDSSFNGTSTLSRHIEKVCKKYPPRMELDQHVLTSDQTKNASLAMRKWCPDACITACCKMIVMDELPFSQVEKAGFKHFCSVVVPQWTIPCRKVIVNRFFEMYEAQKEKLSGWRMHKRILNFCVIANHQGTSIGKLLEACLVQWKIDKVLTVSVDNASANKVAIDYLRKKMGLTILDRSVAAIRNAVKYGGVLRRALELRKGFEMMAEEEEQKFYSYFDEDDDIVEDNEEVREEDKNKKRRKRIGPPNDSDWERAAVFVQFLKVFYNVTLKISATTKPTAHMAFHQIVTIEGEIDSLFVRPEMAEGSEAEKVLVSMAVKMKSKFKKYFGALEDLNQLLLVALVLDPRYKLRNFEHVLVKYLDYDTCSMKEKSRKLKDLLVSLTDLYASSSTSQKKKKQQRTCSK